MELSLRCPKCKLESYPDINHRVFKDGTKHIEARCVFCGRHIQYLPFNYPRGGEDVTTHYLDEDDEYYEEARNHKDFKQPSYKNHKQNKSRIYNIPVESDIGPWRNIANYPKFNPPPKPLTQPVVKHSGHRYGSEVLKFGKYKGKSLEWIRQNNISYLKWMLTTNMDKSLKFKVQQLLNY